MSSSAARATLLFKGLSYLYHIDRIRISPVGYDRNGVRYFEIIDLSENKQFFTAEVYSYDDDMVLKDKYGITRLCIHGWSSPDQLDVYININKPVGCVKQKVIYNHLLEPLYKVDFINFGLCTCLGLSGYRLSSIASSKMIGMISPESSSMFATFDQFLDEGPKACIVAYCLQLAVTKFHMLSMKLQKIKYIYKDREQAKARKLSHKLAMEEIRKHSEAADRRPTQTSQPSVIIQPIAIIPDPPSTKAETTTKKQKRLLHEKKSSQPNIIIVQVPPNEPSQPPPAQPAPQVVVVVPEQSSKVPTILPPPPPPVTERDSQGRIPQLTLVRKKVEKKGAKTGQSLQSDLPPAETAAGDDHEDKTKVHAVHSTWSTAKYVGSHAGLKQLDKPREVYSSATSGITGVAQEVLSSTEVTAELGDEAQIMTLGSRSEFKKLPGSDWSSDPTLPHKLLSSSRVRKVETRGDIENALAKSPSAVPPSNVDPKHTITSKSQSAKFHIENKRTPSQNSSNADQLGWEEVVRRFTVVKEETEAEWQSRRSKPDPLLSSELNQTLQPSIHGGLNTTKHSENKVNLGVKKMPPYDKTHQSSSVGGPGVVHPSTVKNSQLKQK